MLIILVRRSRGSKVGVDEDDLRERAQTRRGQEERRDRLIVGRISRAKAVVLTDIFVIVRPGNAMFVELVEDGSRDRFVSDYRRNNVAGGQMSE